MNFVFLVLVHRVLFVQRFLFLFFVFYSRLLIRWCSVFINFIDFLLLFVSLRSAILICFCCCCAVWFLNSAFFYSFVVISCFMFFSVFIWCELKLEGCFFKKKKLSRSTTVVLFLILHVFCNCVLYVIVYHDNQNSPWFLYW